MLSTSRHGAALALAALLMSGCSQPDGEPGAPGGGDASPEADIPAAPESWVHMMNLSLAYVAGVGVDSFVGDTTLGATSHEQCPRAMFNVPAGIAAMRFTWAWSNVDSAGPGAGDYQVMIKSPDTVWMAEPIVASATEAWKEIVDETPAPGIWEVKLEPHGAAVNLTWVVSVTMEGTGTTPDLIVYHDGDCI